MQVERNGEDVKEDQKQRNTKQKMRQRTTSNRPRNPTMTNTLDAILTAIAVVNIALRFLGWETRSVVVGASIKASCCLCRTLYTRKRSTVIMGRIR
jgi:hypothetical protein